MHKIRNIIKIIKLNALIKKSGVKNQLGAETSAKLILKNHNFI